MTLSRRIPGHVVSVLTPTSRYAEPFLRYIASGDEGPRDLYIVQGPGSFGRQVAEGAAMMARELGVRAWCAPSPASSRLPGCRGSGTCSARASSSRTPNWSPDRCGCLTLRAGCARWLRASASSPRPSMTPRACSASPSGSPAAGMRSCSGRREEEFLRAYTASGGSLPDYPAAQAAAGAIIAAHCARLAGSTSRDDLWAAAADLETSTLFGGFKIDPHTGAQVSHRTVLVRWTGDELEPVGEADR